MTAKLKTILIVSLKQAVNAILTNTALATLFSQTFNAHSLQGWLNMGKATLIAVAVREVTVWGPKLFKWSQSSTTGDNS